MATIGTFDELEVWQKARDLSLDVYNRTTSGPFARDFALKDQINRSSGSVPDNIAEGFGRGGNKELIQFLSYARGSMCELQSQLFRALDRKHITHAEFDDLNSKATTVGKMISKFMQYLSQSGLKGTKFK